MTCAWGNGPRSFVSALVFKRLYFPLTAPVLLGACLLILVLLFMLALTTVAIFSATIVLSHLTGPLRPIAAAIPWPKRGGEPAPPPLAPTGIEPTGADDDAGAIDSTLDRILGLRNAARYYDVVFEGGCVKAIGQIGAVEVCEQHGLVPRYLAGTSGGAIIAAALAVRDTSGEMAPIINSGNLTEYLDSRLLLNQATLRQLLYGISPMLATATLHYGAVRGVAFLDMIRRKLRTMYNRNNPGGRRLVTDDVTFDELRFPQHHDDLDRRQRLRIVATDITRRKALQFPKDLGDYKRIESGPLSSTADQGFPIALAVRMSMAIPALFDPVRAIDTEDALCHIVDGGGSSNHSNWLFDSPKPPTAPTFGFLLDEKIGSGYQYNQTRQALSRLRHGCDRIGHRRDRPHPQ